MNTPENTADPLSGKYLMFTVNQIQYAINLLKVKEIVGKKNATPLPESPNYVKGIVTLRGIPMPVIDLKVRLGLPETEDLEDSPIIVLQKVANQGASLIGLLVDKVSDVNMLTPEEIEDIGMAGTHLKQNYILGVSKAEGKEAIILEIDTLLSAEDITLPKGL